MTTEEEPVSVPGDKSKKNKYRRDKPWDGDHIDHWKVEVSPPEIYLCYWVPERHSLLLQ
jgi:hypothetical protein